MDVNPQYRPLLERLSTEHYTDMSGLSTAATIALEDMEYEGLIEAEEPGSLAYRLTAQGAQARAAPGR